MRNMILSWVIACGAALGLLLVAVPARDLTFDLRTGDASVYSGGTLTQSGTNFIGVHIPIDLIEVVDSLNGIDGVYDVDGPIAVLTSDGTPTALTAGALEFAIDSTCALVGSVPGLW